MAASDTFAGDVAGHFVKIEGDGQSLLARGQAAFSCGLDAFVARLAESDGVLQGRWKDLAGRGMQR
jgi:hypothetical protein